MAHQRIAIAGAGIGGLAAALALARKGFSVALFEKAPILEEAGAGIQLSPNAMRVLGMLGLLPSLADRMVEPEAILIRAARSGSEIARLPLADARARWGAPYGVIHRADLQMVLHEAVRQRPEISLTLGAAVSGARQDHEGISLDIARDGAISSMRADVVVGADGLWSTIAPLIGMTAAPRFSGKRACRATIPIGEVPAPLRGPVTGLWLGRHAHLVHYPVRAGDALNLVVVLEDAKAGSGWSEPGDAAGLAHHLRGWTSVIRELVARSHDWRSWPLFDRPHPGPMAAGRIALLGDAAHPVLPFLAQGGALAIEDAAVLATMLARPGTVEHRLAAYQEARAERVARVQKEARLNGRRYHWPWPLSAARDAGLRLAGGRALLTRYDWLYGWRPPEA
jgi:salicylate hydroxylase